MRKINFFILLFTAVGSSLFLPFQHLNAQSLAGNLHAGHDHGPRTSILDSEELYLPESKNAVDLGENLSYYLLEGFDWDAGPAGCTHNNCTGGDKEHAILDTQPKYANSAQPIVNRAADCPDTYTNNGLTCGRGSHDMPNGGSRPADCPPGYTNNGLTCGRGSHNMPNGGSRPADCPPGYTNNGLTCGRGSHDMPNGGSRPADCPPGYTNNGLTCGRGSHDISSGGSTVADCPSGYTNMGLTCYRGPSTKGKCKSWCSGGCDCHGGGYTNNGCTCGRGASTKGVSSMTCPAGKFMSGGRCYKNCPSGYRNMGLTCHRPASTKGESSMECNPGEFKSGGRCYKNCPTDYVNMGATCHRPVSTKGEGSMRCRPNEFKVAGRCYKDCPAEYINMGATCHKPVSTLGLLSMFCKPGEFINSGRCYKECPAGYRNMGATCHRPASTLGHTSMSCKPGETMGGVRCYKCGEGREYYGTLCYNKCPSNSKRTAVSTCRHEIKLGGNTHLWMVDHGLELLGKSSDLVAKETVERMNVPSCRKQWEQGLWDGDDMYVDEPATKYAGSHFYNGAKKDPWGNPSNTETYLIMEVEANVLTGINARDAAKKQIDNISHLQSENDCYKLGLALHYMTDMTQPMHTTGFSGASIPTMLHPMFEYYVPFVQDRYGVEKDTFWNERWKDKSPDNAFHESAVQSASLSPSMMKSLEYKGTICTMSHNQLYTGNCFINDPKVDEQIGIVLRDGYHSVASYLYTVFKAKYQKNLAFGKTATQSSNAYDVGLPESAVDGKTNGMWAENSITHTQHDENAWWQVDLGTVHDINSIIIHNRLDCCSDRLNDFSILVSETPFTDNSGGATFASNEPYKEGVLTFSGNERGRYVRIFLNGTNYLSLAEVEIYGPKD